MVRMRYTEISVAPFVSHYHQQRPLDWDRLFGRGGPLDVEIGSGMGEFLIRHAQEHPQRNVVGIEQDWQRVKKTLRRIQLQQEPSKFCNIRVLLVDATVALERLFRPTTIDRVYCLFPCPWLKKSHVKYRLFSRDFLRLTNSRLKENGDIWIVTDALAYQEWILEQISQTGFQLSRKTTGPRFDTKYERKWHAQGQMDFYELTLVKKEHIPVSLEEDCELRIFFAEDFQPRKFQFNDIIGRMTIVCKEFLYDDRQRRAMVHLVVAEPNITQHLWVMISPSGKGWSIAKAEGQTVLPTRGVAEAIRSVYDEVRRTAPTTSAGGR